MSGEWIALLSALVWAVATVGIAVGARRLHVVPLNLLRCTISTAFFWALLPAYGGFRTLSEISLQAWLGLGASVLFLLVVGDTLFFRSLSLAGVSWAMPVVNISPLWAVMLAALFVGEPLTGSLLGGAALVVLGVALVSRSSGRQAGVTEAPAVEREAAGAATGGARLEETGQAIGVRARRTGLLMAAAVSVLWAMGNVVLKPASAGISAVVANSVRQPLAVLMLFGMTLAGGHWREYRTLDKRSWLILCLASLVGTGVGSLLFVMAIQRAGAGRASVLVATTPMLALPFSMLWLHERPSRRTLVGTVLTVAGIVLVAV